MTMLIYKPKGTVVEVLQYSLRAQQIQQTVAQVRELTYVLCGYLITVPGCQACEGNVINWMSYSSGASSVY